jgi:hypothetical protein
MHATQFQTRGTTIAQLQASASTDRSCNTFILASPDNRTAAFICEFWCQTSKGRGMSKICQQAVTYEGNERAMHMQLTGAFLKYMK